MAPKDIPDTIAMIEEEELPIASAGVVGGIASDIGGTPGGVIGGIIGAVATAAPPPPPPVKKTKAQTRAENSRGRLGTEGALNSATQAPIPTAGAAGAYSGDSPIHRNHRKGREDYQSDT